MNPINAKPDKTVNSIQTGDFLSALRKSKGLTQQEIAEQLGITNKTISKWERGDGLPDITMLPLLAEIYNVTSDELLAGHRIISINPSNTTLIAQNNKKRVDFMLHKKYYEFTNITIFLSALLLFVSIAFFTLLLLLPVNHIITISIGASMALFAVLLFGFSFELITYRSFFYSIKNIESEWKGNSTYNQYIKKVQMNLRFILILYTSFAIIILPLSACKESITYNNVSFLTISLQKYLLLLPKLIVIASIISIFIDAFLRMFYFKQGIPFKVITIFLSAMVMLFSLFYSFENILIHQQKEETLTNEDFEDFVRRYLTIYNVYLVHSPIQSLENFENTESSSPELSYGVTKTDPDLLDKYLNDSPRYDPFRNVTGFNYTKHCILRRFTTKEQIKRTKKIHTVFIPLYIIEFFSILFFYNKRTKKLPNK